MNRKKLISVGLTAAMLTGLLAGCGDSSQNSSQNGSGSEPVVLQWWGSFPENMGPNQVCEAFNKIDPNLQVEYTRFVMMMQEIQSWTYHLCLTAQLMYSLA